MGSGIFIEESFVLSLVSLVSLVLFVSLVSFILSLVSPLVSSLVLSNSVFNIFSKLEKVDCNLFWNSSLLIYSNNFKLSPKDSLDLILVIILNKISCKYFHIVDLIFESLSEFLYNSLKFMLGKK